VPVAIVTGGNSGIGRAAAVALAQRGFDVGIVWHSDEDNARETVAECEGYGVRAEARRADLSEPGADAVIDELADALGGVDALVNNAGAGHGDAFVDTEVDTFRWVLELDLVAPFQCAKRAARRMIDAGSGRIVNVTSVHEHVPLEQSSAYVAAKHGLGGLTKVMALELAEHGILVNSVAPGQIATPMTGAYDQDPHTIERPAIPLRRPGHAREIAGAIAHLCSRESTYTTGASRVVDGGLLLMAAVYNQDT
jgi:NAD(P)-dependent dehydrogenase (short-subunit alcohol dehydrogenase family)